jgi:hypothetical protein
MPEEKLQLNYRNSAYPNWVTTLWALDIQNIVTLFGYALSESRIILLFCVLFLFGMLSFLRLRSFSSSLGLLGRAFAGNLR